MQIIKPYRLLLLVMVSIVASVIILILLTDSKKSFIADNNETFLPNKQGFEWEAPDIDQLPFTSEGELIRYGKSLIVNTSFYLGPRGKVAAISNGMNCQNCHLEAGTRLWGNNYSAVASTYPKFRERSGTTEDIYKRVNDCIERSLNGKGLDTSSREMQAIHAYIKWLGEKVPKNVKPVGAGITDIHFLNRAADPAKGQIVYKGKCQRCHGAQGQGQWNYDSTLYTYPPLWGEHSYNIGAGLYRISRLAGYVKDNMPFDIAHHATPDLTDEEAWDVAAFVNSRPRPEKVFKNDWPNISAKPLDHPFGPYADNFSETQHKYGPFEPIKLSHESKQTNRNKRS
jgi:thiosulfate dehydrogenase